MKLKQLENHESKATHVLELYNVDDDLVLKAAEMTRQILVADGGRNARLVKIDSSSDEDPQKHEVFFQVS